MTIRNHSEMLMMFGVNIMRGHYDQVIEQAVLRGSREEAFVISTLNVPMVKELSRNFLFRSALCRSQAVIPDGIGIVLASKILYGRRGLKARITGPDLLQAFSRVGQKAGTAFFFLGSTQTVLDQIIHRMKTMYPSVRVVGSNSPPFGHWGKSVNKEIIEQINRSQADVLWVGMTAPRQEIWVYQNRNRLRVPVIASVGAAFDFFSGARERAPRFFRRAGLEWTYRIFQEPVRLGRRYFMTIPHFVVRVFSEWISKHLRKRQAAG